MNHLQVLCVYGTICCRPLISKGKTVPIDLLTVEKTDVIYYERDLQSLMERFMLFSRCKTDME